MSTERKRTWRSLQHLHRGDRVLVLSTNTHATVENISGNSVYIVVPGSYKKLDLEDVEATDLAVTMAAVRESWEAGPVTDSSRTWRSYQELSYKQTVIELENGGCYQVHSQDRHMPNAELLLRPSTGGPYVLRSLEQVVALDGNIRTQALRRFHGVTDSMPPHPHPSNAPPEPTTAEMFAAMDQAAQRGFFNQDPPATTGNMLCEDVPLKLHHVAFTSRGFSWFRTYHRSIYDAWWKKPVRLLASGCKGGSRFAVFFEGLNADDASGFDRLVAYTDAPGLVCDGDLFTDDRVAILTDQE